MGAPELLINLLELLIILIGVALWLAPAYVIGQSAQGIGRNGVGWFLFSAFFSPFIGGILLLLAGRREAV